MPIAGGFCLFEVCFIKPTAATIRHESDPMLAAVFFMNRDVPNVIYGERQTSGSTSMPACDSSKMSDAEKLILPQASVFCPQTTASDPISAAARFLISSCPLSLTSQSRKLAQTQHRACSENQLSESDWK